MGSYQAKRPFIECDQWTKRGCNRGSCWIFKRKSAPSWWFMKCAKTQSRQYQNWEESICWPYDGARITTTWAGQSSTALRVDVSPQWLALEFIQTRDTRESIDFLPNIDCFFFESVFIPLCCVQASILDLHSGALSMGKQFVNIYKWVCCVASCRL